jgi:hypothetical protein
VIGVAVMVAKIATKGRGAFEKGRLLSRRRYLLKVPESKYTEEAMGVAAEALVMAAEGRGPMMHANVGIARVAYRPKKLPEPQPSKKKHWGRRKLARSMIGLSHDGIRRGVEIRAVLCCIPCRRDHGQSDKLSQSPHAIGLCR